MPRKKLGQIGDTKIKTFSALIDSDSDSYGSQGGLKEKVVKYKTRGGKKRNKGKNESDSDGDSG